MTGYIGAARAYWLFALLAVSALLPALVRADPLPAPVPIGYFSWDVTHPGVSGQFDIVDLTGDNSSGDESWPVFTAVSLSDFSLVVHFTDGSSSTFGNSYFTLSADGYSFDGAAFPIGGASPMPTDALLTGTFGPLAATLFDGQPVSFAPGFSAPIDFRDGGLADGDLQLIEATMITASVPEPGTVALMIAGLGVLGLTRQPWRHRAPLSGASVAVCIAGTMLAAPTSAAVKVTTWTAPSSGTAGSDYVNVTVSGVNLAPGKTFKSADVAFAASCGGATIATVPAASIKLVVGTSWRVQFPLPDTLGTGTYAVAMTGASSDNSAIAGSNCSEVAVTAASGGAWTTLIGREWALSAGNEGYKCIGLVLAEDLYISSVHSVAPAGDFQRLLTVGEMKAGLPTGPFDCNGSSVGQHGVYMSGVGGNDLVLPAGAAVHLRAGQWLVLSLHLWNPGTEAVEGKTEIQIRTVPASSVTASAELQLIGSTGFALPPDAPAMHTISGHCSTQSPFDILALAPRMELIGKRIQLAQTSADSSDTTLIDKPYSATMQSTYPLAPATHVAAGDKLTTTCTYVNKTGAMVYFGEAMYNEQCWVGIYRSPPSTQVTPDGSLTPEPLYSCVKGTL